MFSAVDLIQFDPLGQPGNSEGNRFIGRFKDAKVRGS